MKKLITICILLVNLSTIYAQEAASAKTDVYDCSEPTKDDFKSICTSMYQRYEAHNQDNGLGFSYQEELWNISCATPGIDPLDIGRTKIQKMWIKYRQNFRCYGFPSTIATDMNILKFSLDTGFTSFIYEVVKKYKLDVNFIDPADGKTILDWIKEQEELIRKRPPINTLKADEYQTIYKMLRTNGAKHSSELNK
nr:hypothetical protein [uncultured Flavobacterium sp.]